MGGNSLTSMIATITPANTHLDETLSTLRYACQARSIVNRARINENPHDRLIRELKSEVLRLKALKQDYERSSFLSNSSTSSLNESSKEELDELRKKLTAAEENLQSAETNWKLKFIEHTHTQMRELAESEKRREELESQFRVMKTIDLNSADLDLSLYKTNFLEELEGVLTDENGGILTETALTDRLIDWCCQNSLHCSVSSTTITITDNVNKKQTFLLVKDINKLSNYENISDFITSLTWIDIRTDGKKLSKREVMLSLDQIYQALNNLQPPDDANHLNLLYAKVNKTLQSFENALLNNLVKSKRTKSVTFKL